MPKIITARLGNLIKQDSLIVCTVPGREPVRVIAGLRSRRAGMIFGHRQEAATMAYLTRMVLRGAAPQRGAKKHAALRVGLKCPVCFVVGSRRLIIKSRLDPPSRIRDISDPSQSRPLLGQAPSNPADSDPKRRHPIFPGSHKACLPRPENCHLPGKFQYRSPPFAF